MIQCQEGANDGSYEIDALEPTIESSTTTAITTALTIPDGLYLWYSEYNSSNFTENKL